MNDWFFRLLLLRHVKRAIRKINLPNTPQNRLYMLLTLRGEMAHGTSGDKLKDKDYFVKLMDAEIARLEAKVD